MIGTPGVGLDSNWVVTGFDNALEAKRRVDALLDTNRVPGLERLGVTLGHGASVYLILDSVSCVGQAKASRARTSSGSPLPWSRPSPNAASTTPKTPSGSSSSAVR